MSVAEVSEAMTDEELAASELRRAIDFVVSRECLLKVIFVGVSKRVDGLRAWVQFRSLVDMREKLRGAPATVERSVNTEKWQAVVEGIEFECNHYSPVDAAKITRTETL